MTRHIVYILFVTTPPPQLRSFVTIVSALVQLTPSLTGGESRGCAAPFPTGVSFALHDAIAHVLWQTAVFVLPIANLKRASAHPFEVPRARSEGGLRTTDGVARAGRLVGERQAAHS